MPNNNTHICVCCERTIREMDHALKLNNNHEQYVCGGCKRHYRQCIYCDNYHQPTALIEDWRGYRLCEDCAGNMPTCRYCDRPVSDDDVLSDDSGITLCPTCRDNNYRTCEECDCFVHGRSIYVLNGSEMCASCHDDLRRECTDCGCSFRSTDEDEEYCPSCRNIVNAIDNDPLPFCGSRTVGIELETRNNNLKLTKHFKGVRDGSLDGGLEYVSSILGGKAGYEALSGFINKNNAEIGKDCGYHVHLYAGDMNWGEIARIFYFYYRLQPFFFSLVAKSRQTNNFCRQFDRDQLHEINVFKDLKNWTKEDVFRLFYQTTSPSRSKYSTDKRYTWLNLHSYHAHKTIENRLHQGTFNLNKIVSWIRLNQSCFNVAQKLSMWGIKTYAEKTLIKKVLEDAGSYGHDLMGYITDRQTSFQNEYVPKTRAGTHDFGDDIRGNSDRVLSNIRNSNEHLDWEIPYVMFRPEGVEPVPVPPPQDPLTWAVPEPRSIMGRSPRLSRDELMLGVFGNTDDDDSPF